MHKGDTRVGEDKLRREKMGCGSSRRGTGRHMNATARCGRISAYYRLVDLFFAPTIYAVLALQPKGSWTPQLKWVYGPLTFKARWDETICETFLQTFVTMLGRTHRAGR